MIKMVIIAFLAISFGAMLGRAVSIAEHMEEPQ